MDSFGVPLVGGVDALVIYLAVKTPHMAYIAATTATVGSMLGNLLLFLGARYGVRRFASDEAPDGKRRKFRLWFQRYGLLTVFIPAVTPFVPLPLKVFVISAGVLRTPLAQFVAVILVARVIRYFGEAYLGIRLGLGAQDYLRHNKWTLMGVAVGLALAMVLLLRLAERRRSAARATVQ